MSGRKRKSIRWKNFGPAMRLDLAGPRTLAQHLKQLEHENANPRCAARSAHRGKAVRTTENQQHGAERVPQPPIAHTRRGDHPVTKPSWRAPAVHAPHQPMISAFDEAPYCSRDGHRITFNHTDASTRSTRCSARFTPPASSPTACPDAIAAADLFSSI